MTPETWNGSRWAVLPQVTPVRNPHDCPGDECRTCARRIAEAEDAAGYAWPDMGDVMDDRAEREMGWRE